MTDSIRSVPLYTEAAGFHEQTVQNPESQKTATPTPADSWGFTLPGRVLTNVGNRFAPPPGYTRHPKLRQKAAKKGAAWGAGIGLLAGPGATCFGIFGPGHYKLQGGYLAGKGLGYVIVGSIIGGALAGAVIGYGVGYAVGGIVDETLIVADHIQHAAHELSERFHQPHVRQPDAAHLA